MDTPAPDAAGQGNFVRISRDDLRLLRKAAREDWGVPGEVKNEAIYQALKILASPQSSHRDRLAASKFLLQADRADSLHAASHRHDDQPTTTVDPEAARRVLDALAGEGGPGV